MTVAAIFFAWADTPEGKAYKEAKRKDWEEVGEIGYDTARAYKTLYENAAQTSALYWSAGTWWSGTGGYPALETNAPHRFKWAEEWLTKR